MAKFRFYQDKEVKTWVRDYFTVEAESLEGAIDFLKSEGESLETLEHRQHQEVVFESRDTDPLFDCMEDMNRFEIYSCDLDAIGEDSCILKGQE